MRRWIVPVSWLLFLAMTYLILAESISPWFSLPELDNIKFTLIFVFFSLAHCIALEGLWFTALFFSTSAIISYGLEEIGVRTGLLYGAYHYSDMLGPKLGNVPAIIPLAWFMMVYPCWIVGRAVLRYIDTRSLPGQVALAVVAAFTITGWDMVMDPGMAAAQNWVWEQGGAYFGVPLRNYFGWMLTTFLIYLIAGILWHKGKRERRSTQTFAALPVILYAFYAFRYVMANSIPALKVVAVFTMGAPAVLALINTFMTGSNPSEPSPLSQTPD